MSKKRRPSSLRREPFRRRPRTFPQTRPLRRPPCPATHAISRCPRRLGWPRTLAFHAGNVGSNPAGDARAFAALTGSWTIARASNLPCSDAWGTYRVTCGCGPRCGSVREPLNCRMQEIGHCVRVALRHALVWPSSSRMVPVSEAIIRSRVAKVCRKSFQRNSRMPARFSAGRKTRRSNSRPSRGPLPSEFGNTHSPVRREGNARRTGRSSRWDGAR